MCFISCCLLDSVFGALWISEQVASSKTDVSGKALTIGDIKDDGGSDRGDHEVIKGQGTDLGSLF